MKAHIGVDDESGLVHSIVGTAANVADVTQVDKLLHGAESVVSADAGYTGVEWKSALSMRGVRSSGRSQLDAALTKNTAKTPLCTNRSARSRKPRPKSAPGSNTRSG